MKVVTILGTRPEIIKLSLIINELDKHFEHILVHTGQNYDYNLNQVFFDEMNIRRPNYFLNASTNIGLGTVANIISMSYELLLKLKPDAVLIYGDTNSGLSAYSAKRLKIPVFHMEAGNRCFDERVPEEINRKIIDHISDINMVISDHARRNLEREGIKSDRIIKVGSCMDEVIGSYALKIEEQNIEFENNSYILISLHREENVDLEVNVRNFISILSLLRKKYNKTIIISCHPRLIQRIKDFGYFEKINQDSNILFLSPFGFLKYIKLQKYAFVVISDSGTISEESNLVGFPAVTIRYAHERLEGMDQTTVVMSSLSEGELIDSINMVVNQKSAHFPGYVEDYKADIVSKKIPRIIQSYTEFINSNTWRKQG
jgi:UDP-N-acetylglucosamine 2-epimerase (non-hydrolysing)